MSTYLYCHALVAILHLDIMDPAVRTPDIDAIRPAEVRPCHIGSCGPFCDRETHAVRTSDSHVVYLSIRTLLNHKMELWSCLRAQTL